MAVQREFRASVVIACPPERAFDFVADHRNVAPVLEGVTRWEPRGRATGAGARYRVEIIALGVSLPAELRLDQWQRPRRIGWVSEPGSAWQRGRWTFTPAPGGVRVELRIAYRLPRLAAVLAPLAPPVEALVRRRLERALERIRDRLEVAA